MLTCWGPAVTLASAEPAAAPATVIHFDIPRQSLSQAVVAFSRVSGVQVLYDGGVTSQQSSTAVVGDMTSGQALRVLLTGTGFIIRYVGPRSVTLIRQAAETHSPTVMRLDTLQVEAEVLRIGSAPRYGPYAARVLDQVRRELQSDAQTSRGVYSVTVKVWLAADGRVQRSDIMASSGKPEIDARVLRRLNGVVLSERPPPDLPQPLEFAFWAQPTS